MRVSSCNCAYPQTPCQACGAGIPDWNVWRIPATVGQPSSWPAGNVTITPAYSLTEDQIEALIERAIKKALNSRPE